MYIIPDSTIMICKNVPFDPTYDHTVIFASEQRQIAWFLEYSKFQFTKQSYQRTQRNKIRVQVAAESLFDCNYVVYQNISFGNKKFYAFITGVEYINNTVSEITFELDVMQTWMFDYHLDQCFVEREHTRTDYIGDNLIPENFELGEYVFSDLGSEAWMNTNMKIIMASSVDLNLDNHTGGMYGGVYSGINYLVFDNATQANAFLADLTNPSTGDKSSSIVSMFMFPGGFISNIDPTDPQPPVFKSIQFTKESTNIGTYIPRNKKLLTSPYNTFIVTDTNGNYGEFPYEYFNQDSVNFKLYGSLCSDPEFWLVPFGYKGVSNNFKDKLVFKGLPQCAYNTDTFRAWVAQHKYALIGAYWGGAANTITGMMQVGTGIDSEDPNLLNKGGNKIKSGLAASIGAVMAVKQASLMPAHTRGSESNVLATATGELGFHYYRAQIRAEFAKIIDDFFDRYGYACHQNKIPNRSARESWTYTKTIGCTITGSMPADDAAKICSIYNNGITFWADGKKVGDYTQSNDPLGGGD